MGLFDFFRQPDINDALRAFQEEKKAILLDVRTPAEYRAGHIPNSVNLPLQSIDKGALSGENKGTALYVYCQSGARSRQAAALLQKLGFTNVKNIGGIAAYRGKVER